jgi:membrane protease subunit HflK
MAWTPKGGGGQGPWGSGSTGGGPRPPDIEELLRRGQDRFKSVMPGGVGRTRGLILIGLVALAFWLASGFYRVQPEEQGVALIFGKWVATTDPGLRYNLPAPIGAVYKPKVTRENLTNVGFRAGFETPQEARRQRQGGARSDVIEESLMLTGDENIIDVQFVTFWVIRDAGEFLFQIRNPAQTVKDASESAMRELLGKSGFEFVRTKGRVKIQDEAKTLIQSILNDYGAGISVTRVQLQKIDPPGRVLDSFRDVQAARADKERAVNEAQAYLNEVVQRAEGEAQKIVKEAEGYKQQKIAIASGESQRFLSVYKEYLQDKSVTTRRLYLETMKSVMSGMDKVLIDNQMGGSGVVPYLPLRELGRRGGETTQ